MSREKNLIGAAVLAGLVALLSTLSACGNDASLEVKPVPEASPTPLPSPDE